MAPKSAMGFNVCQYVCNFSVSWTWDLISSRENLHERGRDGLIYWAVCWLSYVVLWEDSAQSTSVDLSLWNCSVNILNWNTCNGREYFPVTLPPYTPQQRYIASIFGIIISLAFLMPSPENSFLLPFRLDDVFFFRSRRMWISFGNEIEVKLIYSVRRLPVGNGICAT